MRSTATPTAPNRTKVAMIWIAEDGAERKVTYYELRQLVSRLASGLRSLGVAKGDRVLIYMPLTLEGVMSMLACARLGAIHSVVYAGMGVGALRDRIMDAGAKVVIAGNMGVRRGKAVDLRSIVDQATEDLRLRHVVWFQRGAKAELRPHEVDFDELMARSKPDVDPEPVDAEHPLYILYTSGSTGKPKGVVHVHGGYMVGVSYHLRHFYDVKDNDVFWATSDIGWVVGHSYIVYGPLVEGVTSVFREGAPDWPDPGIFWQCVEKYGVNVMFTAPTAVRMFMKFGPDYVTRSDLSTLRLIAVAGEPLNPEAMRWAHQWLLDNGKRGFVADNWWQTELGAPTIGTTLGMNAVPGAAGVALPGRRGGGGGRKRQQCAARQGRPAGAAPSLPAHDAHDLGQSSPLRAVLDRDPQLLCGGRRGQLGRERLHLGAGAQRRRAQRGRPSHRHGGRGVGDDHASVGGGVGGHRHSRPDQG